MRGFRLGLLPSFENMEDNRLREVLAPKALSLSLSWAQKDLMGRVTSRGGGRYHLFQPPFPEARRGSLVGGWSAMEGGSVRGPIPPIRYTPGLPTCSFRAPLPYHSPRRKGVRRVNRLGAPRGA
jgi:hypothetical protein